MRIFEIVLDVNNYQSFLVEDDMVWKGDSLTFDCTPKASIWVAPDVFVLHPKLRRGNFMNLCPGSIVFDAVATELLQSFLEMSGELLPLFYKGEDFTVLNVTECIDVLDQDRTEWVYGKTTGAKIKIEKYAFHANRLTETPLFKIPETCKSRIYTVEGLIDPKDEFKSCAERNGLEGLIFKELWNDA